jgi:hypothetical protein
MRIQFDLDIDPQGSGWVARGGGRTFRGSTPEHAGWMLLHDLFADARQALAALNGRIEGALVRRPRIAAPLPYARSGKRRAKKPNVTKEVR